MPYAVKISFAIRKQALLIDAVKVVEIQQAKADQLEWRRSKVVEMRARGLSLGEIARELQVSRASISSDMQYLRNQAKESIVFVTYPC